jgi:hypothetical protein
VICRTVHYNDLKTFIRYLGFKGLEAGNDAFTGVIIRYDDRDLRLHSLINLGGGWLNKSTFRLKGNGI